MCRNMPGKTQTFLSVAAIVIVSSVSDKAQTASDRPSREFGWSVSTETSKQKKLPRDLPPKPQPISEETDTIRVDTMMAVNEIMVYGKNGMRIEHLKADDFVVLEDGVPQEIEIFSYGASVLPRSITLIIDHSQSQWRYIKDSIDAAKILTDAVAQNDEIAIVTDSVEVAVSFTTDRNNLKSSLEKLRSKTLNGDFGKSMQYSSLMAVLNEMSDRTGTRQIIVFQTDGDQLRTLRSENEELGGTTRFTFDQIVALAKRKGVIIHTVYSGIDLSKITKRDRKESVRKALEDERYAASLSTKRQVSESIPLKLTSDYLTSRAELFDKERAAVESLAVRTGGLAQTLGSSADAAAVYGNILSEMDRRYVIGYYPKNQAKDGKLRKVKVTLRGNSGYQVTSRKSYVAPEAAN